MKPDPDVSGVPFNFDAIPMWLYPDVWDETKQVRLRGLWFVLLYTLSALIFTGVVAIFLALIFSKSMTVMAIGGLFFGGLGGIVIGLSAWWDFTHRRKKLLLEDDLKKTEAQSQEPTQK